MLLKFYHTEWKQDFQEKERGHVSFVCFVWINASS